MTAPRVAILGGGMAGLAAAWRLTRPGGPGAEVTVYQRGARLGGKAASSRGVHGRIEEHGLHVWLGYYDNAFRLIREVYDELDRSRSDPGCPITSWLDAFAPASVVALGEEDHEGWHDWLAAFPEDDRLPGEPLAAGGSLPVTELVERSLGLLARLGASFGPRTASPRAVLSSRPLPPRAARPVTPEGLRQLLDGLAGAYGSAMAGSVEARRAAQLADLLVALLRGVAADALLVRGYTAIDHLDFREWLARHGAAPSTLDSALIRGMYDLVFGYARGDRSRPAFAAGLGLHLAGRIFFDYKGAIFWKMRAGMGDAVVAPMYEALRRRGVRFELLHRLDGLHLTPDGASIATVTLGRQARLRPGLDGYEPLVRVRGLPVFPDRLDLEQLDAPPAIAEHDLEAHDCAWPDAATVRLEAGRDFDVAVLAVSLGMVPHVCAEILARDELWQEMVANVATVATQAAQLWLRPDERALGWPAGAATVTGCGAPFDSFSSVSHVLAHEDWPETDRPRTAAAFCATFPDPEGSGAAAASVARAGLARFLDEHAGRLWPAATGADGFRWDLLCGAGDSVGPDRLASQYVRVNVDPSDRYVQSLPGSGRHRLRADASGLANLVLAGDWIDSGLNAGCIEAAVLSGLQAANVAAGADLTAGTSGFQPVGGGAP